MEDTKEVVYERVSNIFSNYWQVDGVVSFEKVKKGEHKFRLYKTPIQGTHNLRSHMLSIGFHKIAELKEYAEATTDKS